MSAETGRREEIEVTQEMIQAGMGAYLDHDPETQLRAMLVAIYQSMAKAGQEACQKAPEAR